MGAQFPAPQVAGKTFMFFVEGFYEKENPYAGSFFCMNLQEDGAFNYYNFTKKESMSGTYKHAVKKYREEGISMVYFSNDDAFAYTMVLVPKDERTGSYIYRQKDEKAVPEKPYYRMNSGRYVVLGDASLGVCKKS